MRFLKHSAEYDLLLTGGGNEGETELLSAESRNDCLIREAFHFSFVDCDAAPFFFRGEVINQKLQAGRSVKKFSPVFSGGQLKVR